MVQDALAFSSQKESDPVVYQSRPYDDALMVTLEKLAPGQSTVSIKNKTLFGDM